MVVTQVQTIDLADQAVTAAKLSPSVYQRDNFTVGTASGNYTGSTTVFNLNFSYQTGSNSLMVYQDGVLMTVSADYQETNSTTVTFNSARTVGAKMAFVSVIGVAQATSVIEVRENYVAGTPSGNYTGSLTQFDTTSSYVVNGVNLMVFLDGAIQVPGASNDYVENSSTRITFNTALTAGQLVTLVFKQTAAGSNAQSVNGFSASSTPTASTILPLDSSTQYPLTAIARLLSYARPVLKYNSASQVDIQDGIYTGTAGDVTILFPDGSLRTVNNTTYTTFDITRNAVLSGSKQSGLRSSLSEASNTWYAIYAVKATDDATSFVSVGDTIVPLRANISTLNSNFGVNGWVYLGMIRNGDNALQGSNIIPFVQWGNMSSFTRATSASPLTAVGLRMADTAAAGYVGEYISSSATNQGPFGNGVWGDITSISLTAGDWDVTASCNAEPNGSTTFNTFSIGISPNSGNTTSGLTDGLNYMYENTTDQTHNRNLTVTNFRVSLSATTTYYFKARFDYSNGSPRTTGSTIRARRVR